MPFHQNDIINRLYYFAAMDSLIDSLCHFQVNLRSITALCIGTQLLSKETPGKDFHFQCYHFQVTLFLYHVIRDTKCQCVSPRWPLPHLGVFLSFFIPFQTVVGKVTGATFNGSMY